jgi:hypothetical protein
MSMLRFVLYFFAFFNITNAAVEEHKKYIDFQVQGLTVGENNQLSNNNSGMLWTSTNIDIDFNFNKYFSLATVTSLSNRYNGFTRPHALREYVNGGPAVGTLFDNHGLTSRTLALSVHNENTELMVGKIRPNVAIGNDVNASLFNNDWHGLYGMMMNGGYTNSNKIGLQLHADVQMFRNSKQQFDIALFKNDTTNMNDSIFANSRTFGYSMPKELGSVLNKRIAGDTNLPASFSVFFINKATLPNGNNLNYSLTFRRQAVDKTSASFVKDESTYITSAQYEKQTEMSTVGVFGEVAVIQNAYGIASLKEYYLTTSAYFSFDHFTTAFVYNLYKMTGVQSLNIINTNLSQSQISFGYKINPQYRIDIGYKQIKDGITGKSGQGAGLGFYYNLGTKTNALRSRSHQTIT